MKVKCPCGAELHLCPPEDNRKSITIKHCDGCDKNLEVTVIGCKVKNITVLPAEDDATV